MPESEHLITVEQWKKLANDSISEAEDTGVDMPRYGTRGKLI